MWTIGCCWYKWYYWLKRDESEWNKMSQTEVHRKKRMRLLRVVYHTSPLFCKNHTRLCKFKIWLILIIYYKNTLITDFYEKIHSARWNSRTCWKAFSPSWLSTMSWIHLHVRCFFHVSSLRKCSIRYDENTQRTYLHSLFTLRRIRNTKNMRDTPSGYS